MESFVTGATIRMLREKKQLTQGALAEMIGVSDKAVSKWETGKGLPDISLIEPLAACLGISVAELFAGECVVNQNKSSNIRRSKFYVCPICGNVIWATGELAASCCGTVLPVCEAEEPDEKHEITIERVEDEYYVMLTHAMEKTHYISFLAYATVDTCIVKKLYPEGNAECRIPIRGHGTIYAYCNKHGLFMKKL